MKTPTKELLELQAVRDGIYRFIDDGIAKITAGDIDFSELRALL